MLIPRAYLAAALILCPLLRLHAGDAAPADAKQVSTPDVTDSTPEPSKLKMSYEFDGDTSYVGDARTDFGAGSRGDLSEERTRGHFVVAPQCDDGPIYRFGLGYQRYSFGLSKAAPLPNTLQSESLVVGMDFELFNSWLVRVEADPGLYGDGHSFGFRDFNVPFLIGGSYIASADLQWVVGIDVDVDRQIPVIPAVGVRWTIADNWTLNAVLPTPRLEYQWSKSLTLYIGGDVDDGTYRMSRTFGAGYGNTNPRVRESEVTVTEVKGYAFQPGGGGLNPTRPIYGTTKKKVYTTVPNRAADNLDGAVVEYDEVRVGAGFSWKAIKGVTVEIEGGYLPYREFDFHRANTNFNNTEGAPYGQMSVNAQF